MPSKDTNVIENAQVRQMIDQVNPECPFLVGYEYARARDARGIVVHADSASAVRWERKEDDWLMKGTTLATAKTALKKWRYMPMVDEIYVVEGGHVRVEWKVEHGIDMQTIRNHLQERIRNGPLEYKAHPAGAEDRPLERADK